MPLQVSYMGTKRNIASHVADVIADAPPGPLLDLFSGICSIASVVAPSRQIWCNDIQRFASTVAETFFTSPTLPLSGDYAAEVVLAPYAKNFSVLKQRFAGLIHQEVDALRSHETKLLQSLEYTIPTVVTCDDLKREREHLEIDPRAFPYRLFAITYAGGYLGLQQCIQIDSIRYAIDYLHAAGKFDQHQHKWMCLALCQAASKVATTTGHFAQYMRVKENTRKRFISQRRRSVWYEWLRALHQFSPIGTSAWRSRNRVFAQDANILLADLYNKGERPAVIYADPPYTDDQYSRYYHLYETLLLYDYPLSLGIGRYRPDRFRSQYSLKTQVREAMTSLISNCSKLGTRLVLSYPENSLIPNSREFIVSLLERHFGNSYSVLPLEHFHSSLGGSKGHEKYRVTELIFSAG